MAITTVDGLVAAAKQSVSITKTTSNTSTANTPWSVFDRAGTPGAGTLAVGNTTAGVVPTNATAGYPVINAFGGSNLGYITSIDFSSSVAARLTLYDTVFSAGAFAFNQNAALTAPPSFSTRVPGGTDFTTCELWFEAVTAFTGNPSLSVGYTNQAGTSGRSTGTVAFGLAPTIGRMVQLPLQAGDTGVSAISGTITATVATVGTFNLHVLRRLWTARVNVANGGDNHGWDKTGLAQVFATSALRVNVTPDSTSTGVPDLLIEIANG